MTSEQAPKGEQLFPPIWELKKRDIISNLLFKHKARLKIQGSWQEFAANFFNIFSPVVTWFTIRMVLVLSIITGRSTCQVDFILAFLQSNIEFNMYIDNTKGIENKGIIRTAHVLNLLKNIYGQSQVSRVQNKHLTKGPE